MVILTEQEFKKKLEEVCEEVFIDKVYLNNPIVGLLCTMVIKELVTTEEAKLLATMNEEDRAVLEEISKGEDDLVEEKPEE